MQESILTFSPISKHMNSVLTNPAYEYPKPPHYTDTLDLPGVPPNHLIYGERDATGVITMKLDSASVKSFRDDTELYNNKYNTVKLQESMVLANIRSRFSETSAQHIKFTSGANYPTDSLSLSKTWWLIKSSHEKANTIRMLEVVTNLLNVSMNSNEDFYSYTDKMAISYKLFESTFANYLDKPMKHFADLLLVLSLVGGLNQINGVFDTAIQRIRLIDFSTPANLPHYPVILPLLVQANHSSSLLTNKNRTSYGMTAEANSSINPTVKGQCIKCKTPIDQLLNRWGKVKNCCDPCYEKRKGKQSTERRTTNKNENSAAKVSETKPPSKQTSSSTTPPVPKSAIKSVTNAKPATVGNFAGAIPNLAMSASHHFLLNQGENPESELEYEDDDERL